MSDGFGLKIGVEGEREFKKSLAEINQTFKVLGSEMKLVQSQFDKNDNSVEALTARNAALNKQIDTQKEKISTLKAALENAASSFGENDKRTQAWQIQLNNAEAALNKMERELSQNNQALDNVGDEFSKAEKKADKFGDEVKETGEQAESSGAKFKKVGEVLKTVGVAMAAATAAIGTAAVAAGKKLWDMASETAKAGDEIDKTSQKLGMSAEAYQEWDYVLGQAGVDITSMTTGLKTMTNQIDDAKNGSVKAQERFAKLGISLNDLNTMSREDIFSAVVSGMQGMADTTERAALANDLFGKSGQNLTPLFNETTESTEKLKQAAHELGFVMSDEAVKASAEFNDSLDTLKRTFSGVKNNLVGELLPGFSTLLNGLSALLAGNDNAKDQIQKGTQEIVNSLKDIFPRIMDILMTLIGAVAEIAPVIIDSLVQGISANMGELVSAASNIVITFLESLISALPQIAEGAVKLITQLTDAILDNLPLLMSTVMQVIT
ncbi:MAG: phage tail protein, partial [Ruminococcus sp.]|nr:phage tail protein [Ruminococcus sp.]